MKTKILLSVCLAFLCFGCSAITDSQTYKDTKRFYYTHINKPAEVDFSVAEISPVDSRLTKTFAVLDKELTKCAGYYRFIFTVPMDFSYLCPLSGG